MDSHNLATVIAPNILYADAKAGLMDESFLAIEAVHMLLDYNDQMCEVGFAHLVIILSMLISLGSRGHSVCITRYRTVQQHA